MLASKKGISIKIKIDRDLPQIQCDANKIEQVLNNLLSNAIKYSFSKSNILVEVRINEAEQHILTIVKDQGQGIPEEELGKVFEPFQKTSVQATMREKSSGLGLAIVKKMIEAHDGTIGVKSIVGEGSEFFFTLPL